MKLSEIREILEADFLVGEDKKDLEVRAGFGCDLNSDMLTFHTSGALLLTGLTNIQVLRSSFISDVKAIIFVRGKHPNQELIEQARANGFPLMTTRFTMFSACGRLFNKGLRGVDEEVPA
jgi:predicted transcriptional regulator